MAAGRTLIRRYVLALPRQGAGNEAAVTATSVPPLSGGPGSHGSAAHALTIAASADRSRTPGRPSPLLRKGVLVTAGVSSRYM